MPTPIRRRRRHRHRDRARVHHRPRRRLKVETASATTKVDAALHVHWVHAGSDRLGFGRRRSRTSEEIAGTGMIGARLALGEGSEPGGRRVILLPAAMQKAGRPLPSSHEWQERASSFEGQMRRAVLHPGDLGIGIGRARPIFVRRLLARTLAAGQMRSSIVGVATPLSSASVHGDHQALGSPSIPSAVLLQGHVEV